METYQKWETKGRRREIRKGEIRKKQMVLKELERFVKEEDQQQEDNPKMQQLIKDCHNLPFFKFDQFQYRIITREQHHITQFLKYSDYNYSLGGQKYCCFNHIIGLPTKNGIPKPLYDYQQFILKSLFEPAYNNSTVPSHAMADSHQEKYEREKERQRGTSNILSPEKVKHVAVLKAIGLGISELILRVMCWLCLHNDNLKGSQMIIFTGPRLEMCAFQALALNNGASRFGGC